ncbi:MAG: AEC family transporter [Halothiobacillaceae bacterium]
MFAVVSQMAVMILGGVLWRVLAFGGWEADRARTALTTLVYYLLLPALVLSVLWQAPLGLDSVRLAISAVVGVLAGLALMALWGRLRHLPRAQFGALLLASGFPNATYLGLPVLESLFGDTGRAIAVQYDFFACTPLLLSLGILLAVRFGSNRAEAANPLLALLKVPSLWAAALAISLNLAGAPYPDWLGSVLDRLAAGVVPIMLIALGMSLQLSALRPASLLRVSPAIVIQLALMPAVVLATASTLGLSGTMLVGTVLEAAMPVMVLGLVLCDRYGLDTSLYATTATASTLLALVTLPLWHGVLT